MNTSTIIAFAALGLIWGSNFIFMKWAAELISPIQVVFLRVLFGFLPILVLALYRRALRLADLRYWPHFVVMSILATAFYYYAFAEGTHLLPSSVAGMLSGAIPLFTFVMTALFLRQEPVTATKIAAVGIGFLGVLLIARPWSSGEGELNLWGVAALLIGWLLVGEPLRATDLVAMAAIIGGVYAIQASRPDRADRHSAPQPSASTANDSGA